MKEVPVPYSKLRSGGATKPPTAQPSPAERLAAALGDIIRDVVREELDVLRGELMAPPSEYRDRQQEAQRLGISVATLDRLCRDGMPFVHIGESRRFVQAEVDAWIGARRTRDDKAR